MSESGRSFKPNCSCISLSFLFCVFLLIRSFNFCKKFVKKYKAFYMLAYAKGVSLTRPPLFSKVFSQNPNPFFFLSLRPNPHTSATDRDTSANHCLCDHRHTTAITHATGYHHATHQHTFNTHKHITRATMPYHQPTTTDATTPQLTPKSNP